MVKVLTAGSSHGEKIIGILDGFPSNVKINKKYIEKILIERRTTPGRSKRQKKEKDNFEIISGLRKNKTDGSPIGIILENKSKNFKEDFIIMPGHSDIGGLIKYNLNNPGYIRERASARESAIRSALYCFCLKFIESLDIKIENEVVFLGDRRIKTKEDIEKELLKAKREGKTLGGIFKLKAKNIPIGLGSHIQAERRLNSMLLKDLSSINSVKGVEIGEGFSFSLCLDKGADEFILKNKKWIKKTNFAGGIEGGISNGEDILINIAVRPISGCVKGLSSFNYKNKKEAIAISHSSDLTSVFAASIIGKLTLAYSLTNAILEKFGGDSFEEIKERIDIWRKTSCKKLKIGK